MRYNHLLWLAVLAVSAGLFQPANSQLLFPEVTVDLQRLPEEAQAKLRGIDSTLSQYISEARHPWNRDDGAYDLPVQISIYFTEYNANPQEDKYKANMIVTNKGDARYDDKRLEFGLRAPYVPGQGSFDPFFSIIEFYLWVLIGNEEDKYEKLGGNRYYDKAREKYLASASSVYVFGWDKRSDLLREITSEGNKTYREFEFFYHTGIYYDGEQQYEDSKAYLHYALLRLDALPIDKRTEILEAEHMNLANALKNCNYERGIEALRRMDIVHKNEYDGVFGQPQSP